MITDRERAKRLLRPYVNEEKWTVEELADQGMMGNGYVQINGSVWVGGRQKQIPHGRIVVTDQQTHCVTFSVAELYQEILDEGVNTTSPRELAKSLMRPYADSGWTLTDQRIWDCKEYQARIGQRKIEPYELVIVILRLFARQPFAIFSIAELFKEIRSEKVEQLALW